MLYVCMFVYDPIPTYVYIILHILRAYMWSQQPLLTGESAGKIATVIGSSAEVQYSDPNSWLHVAGEPCELLLQERIIQRQTHCLVRNIKQLQKKDT